MPSALIGLHYVEGLPLRAGHQADCSHFAALRDPTRTENLGVLRMQALWRVGLPPTNCWIFVAGDSTIQQIIRSHSISQHQYLEFPTQLHAKFVSVHILCKLCTALCAAYYSIVSSTHLVRTRARLGRQICGYRDVPSQSAAESEKQLRFDSAADVKGRSHVRDGRTRA